MSNYKCSNIKKWGCCVLYNINVQLINRSTHWRDISNRAAKYAHTNATVHYQPSGIDAAEPEDGKTEGIAALLAVVCSRWVSNSRTVSIKLAAFGKSSPKTREQTNIYNSRQFSSEWHSSITRNGTRFFSRHKYQFLKNTLWICSW